MRSYDLNLVVCTLGGVTISGYGEDDAVGVEWASDITDEGKVTADGAQVVYSRLNDKRLNVTLTLMATSKALAAIGPLIETQHGDNAGVAPPVIVPLPFFLFDPSTGTTYTGEAVLVNRPAMSFGNSVGEVEIRLSVPKARYTVGLANVL